MKIIDYITSRTYNQNIIIRNCLIKDISSTNGHKIINFFKIIHKQKNKSLSQFLNLIIK